MSDPLRIVHVITKLDVGGAQRVAVDLCSALVRDGHRVTMVAGNDPGTGGDMRSTCLDQGVEVLDLPSLRRPIRPATDVKAVRELAALLVDIGPDVVHTHSSKGGIVGRLAAHRARVPAVVHTVHGWSFRDYQPWPIRYAYVALERLAGRFTDVLVFVSEADRVEAQNRRVAVQARHVLEPPPVDLGRFRLAERVVEPVVGTVTRLGDPKDHETLLRSFDLVRGEVPSATLVVVGDGPKRAEAEQLAAELGLTPAVRFLGTRADVPELLGSFRCFVLSSISEGRPVSIQEAMAAGVPVVATDVGGVSDLVQDGSTGRLVPRQDPVAMSAAICDVLLDEVDVVGMRDRARRGVEAMSIVSAARRLAGIYRDALAGRTDEAPQ